MTGRDLVTVGVDGTDGSYAAVRWAAREAARTGADLRVVHVFTEYAPMVGFYAAVSPTGVIESHRIAEKIVRSAAREAQPLLPTDRISTVVLRGDRRVGLLQAASDARLLVLGDEPHPTRGRLITGSIVGSVAAHSPVPVAVVPAGWLPDERRHGVVVGVKFADTSAALVRRALRVAAGRDARLTVLHVWEPRPQVDMVPDDVDLGGWEERTRKSLDRVVDEAVDDVAGEVAGDVPGATAEVALRRGQPAYVLTEASTDAELLVITRRLHGFPFGHLGATGRAVLRESRCPVLVLPPAVEVLAPPVPA